MKWFKHYSTARNDERIAKLEDKAGLEGYGFYFKMLEIVAEMIDGTDKCEVVFSLSRWGRQMNVTSKKWLYLSQCCADVGLMLLSRCSDDYVVKIPNLLKYRDNHTKNLQVTSKQEVDKEVDKEVEVEKDKSSAKAVIKTKEFIPPDWIDKSMWQMWLNSRKKMSPEQQKAQVDKLAAWRDSGLDYGGALANSAVNGYTGLFLPDIKKNSIAATQSSNDQAREGARKRLFGEHAHETG